MYKKFFMALMIFGILISGSVANAELKTYEGVGEWYVKENETLDEAKDKAVLLAESDIIEQVEVFVASYSEAHNFHLTKDEIITIAAGVVYPVDKKYDLIEEFDGVLLIKAIVIATVDTEKVVELIEFEKSRRAAKN